VHKRSYTLVFAHDSHGRLRKLRLPGYLFYLILTAALVGGATIAAGIASYARLLVRVTDYNQVRSEREQLRQQNRTLQEGFSQTRQRLSSLESLANEVAVAYGLLRLQRTPFGTVENFGVSAEAHYDFRNTLARFHYLQRNATAVTLYASGARPLPGQDLTQLNYTPSLWPVHGRLISGFGERLDPFNGEGAFHSGVDIDALFGDPVRTSADGFVVAVGQRTGYGRVVVVDHGAGLSTWYAHLSTFRAYLGQAVQRGDVIGYVGSSGRATGSHLHYEVRAHDTPVNPWRFLRNGRIYASASLPAVGGTD
jgi:murein DD-endopeptidase MepM/ murein hydrolase activator NlpD